MTDLLSGELLDLLPSQLNTDVDMVCLSYAIKTASAKLMDLEGQSMIYAGIDRLREDALDLLAVEMQSPYYDQGLDVDAKREIVKKTFAWHARAGTASAMTELIRAVFGSGGVVEWPDFDDGEGEPGTFEVATEAMMTFDMFERFEAVIGKVKSARSHLRGIRVARNTGHMARFGAAVHGYVVAPGIGQWESPLMEGLRYAAATHGYVVATGIGQA